MRRIIVPVKTLPLLRLSLNMQTRFHNPLVNQNFAKTKNFSAIELQICHFYGRSLLMKQRFDAGKNVHQ